MRAAPRGRTPFTRQSEETAMKRLALVMGLVILPAAFATYSAYGDVPQTKKAKKTAKKKKATASPSPATRGRPMGLPLFSCGPRAAAGRALRAACYNPTSGACSSDGQSGSLLSCGSGVRIPSGAPASDGGCSSVWLERQVVALEAAGSNPVIHPNPLSHLESLPSG